MKSEPRGQLVVGGRVQRAKDFPEERPTPGVKEFKRRPNCLLSFEEFAVGVVKHLAVVGRIGTRTPPIYRGNSPRLALCRDYDPTRNARGVLKKGEPPKERGENDLGDIFGVRRIEAASPADAPDEGRVGFDQGLPSTALPLNGPLDDFEFGFDGISGHA